MTGRGIFLKVGVKEAKVLLTLESMLIGKQAKAMLARSGAPANAPCINHSHFPDVKGQEMHSQFEKYSCLIVQRS